MLDTLIIISISYTIGQLSKKEEDAIFRRAPANVNRHEHEQTLAETSAALDEFFRPHNEELARLMGDDKYLYS